MFKNRYYLLMVGWVMSFGGWAQTSVKASDFITTGYIQSQPLVFKQSQLKTFAPMYDLSVIKNNTSSPVIHTMVCYKAFFCRLEVSASKKIGIPVKIHAGDYDRYYRDFTLPYE